MEFTSTPLVRIHVLGDKVKEDPSVPPSQRFPLGRDDHGLVRRLLQWLISADIYQSAGAGSSGGGQFIGYFEPADAEKVSAWLREQPEFQSKRKR